MRGDEDQQLFPLRTLRLALKQPSEDGDLLKSGQAGGILKLVDGINTAQDGGVAVFHHHFGGGFFDFNGRVPVHGLRKVRSVVGDSNLQEDSVVLRNVWGHGQT